MFGKSSFSPTHHGLSGHSDANAKISFQEHPES
jgi:hypothetical protein